MKAALTLTFALWGASAAADCRQALALGLDVSGSVDALEYRLQLDGLANALLHPEVREALLVMPSAPVSLAVYEWSGPNDQRLTLDWTVVSDAAALDAVADRLRRAARGPGELSTALGSALTFGGALLRQQAHCGKRTLDISGDGQSNTGPHPRDSHGALPDGTTVNALVILLPELAGPAADTPGPLDGYFRAYVIDGPDAFVETALGFADFEAAMVRKLKRELQGQLYSQR